MMISVVVPLHNRGQALVPFLAALAAQSYPPEQTELILADDGSTDDTPDIARRFAASAPFQVVYAPLPKGTRAAARNGGAALAAGELLVFLDGDVLADRRLLQAHADAHARLGMGIAVIGRFRPPQGCPPIDHLYATQFHSQFWAIANPDQLPFGFFYTTNVSLRRAEFDRLGGFDAGLPFLEDAEFGYRWLHSGRRLAYAPAASGIHDHHFDLPAILQRQQAIGRGMVHLARRHPDIEFAVRATQRAQRWRRLGPAAQIVGDSSLTLGSYALRRGEYLLPRGLLARGLRAAMGYAKLQGSLRALEDAR